MCRPPAYELNAARGARSLPHHGRRCRKLRPFPVPAPAIGICVGHALTWIGRHTRGNALGSLPLPAALGVAGAAVGVLAIALFVPKVTGAIDLQVFTAFDPRPAVQGAIPQGACVIGDYPLGLLQSDRFSSSKPGCPVVVDPFAM